MVPPVVTRRQQSLVDGVARFLGPDETVRACAVGRGPVQGPTPLKVGIPVVFLVLVVLMVLQDVQATLTLIFVTPVFLVPLLRGPTRLVAVTDRSVLVLRWRERSGQPKEILAVLAHEVLFVPDSERRSRKVRVQLGWERITLPADRLDALVAAVPPVFPGTGPTVGSASPEAR